MSSPPNRSHAFRDPRSNQASRVAINFGALGTLADLEKLEDELGKKKGKTKLHVFKKHHFPKPTWCSFCGEFIWGLGKQGYYCPSCEYGVHKKCFAHAEQTPCVKREKKPLREMSAVELEAYVMLVEKREQRLNQLQEELQRKIQKLEEDRQKLLLAKQGSFHLGNRVPSGINLLSTSTSSSPPQTNQAPSITKEKGGFVRTRTVTLNETKAFVSSNPQSSDLLLQILTDADLKRGFRLFTIGDFSEENLLFYDSIEKYQNASPMKLVPVAHRIFRRYLCDEPRFKVRLPPHIKEKIQRELEKEPIQIDKSLFNNAKKFVFDQMLLETLGRFLMSDLAKGLSNKNKSEKRTPSNTSEVKQEQQRIDCRVDRSLRRNFLECIRMEDFEGALEIFFLLRDSGSITATAGYHKAIFLLLHIADTKQREILNKITQKDGVLLEYIESVMANFQTSFDGKILSGKKPGTPPSGRHNDEKVLSPRSSNPDYSGPPRSVSFTSSFAPHRSFVEKETASLPKKLQ